MFIHSVENIEVKPFNGSLPESHQVIVSYRDGEILKQVTFCMNETMMMKFRSELNLRKPAFEQGKDLVDYVK